MNKARRKKKNTKSNLWKALKIKKGDMVCEWIIPYDEMEFMNIDTGVVIKEAKEQVKDKFSQIGEKMNFIRVFHNVEILDGVYGVYVIGVRRR